MNREDDAIHHFATGHGYGHAAGSAKGLASLPFQGLDSWMSAVQLKDLSKSPPHGPRSTLLHLLHLLFKDVRPKWVEEIYESITMVPFLGAEAVQQLSQRRSDAVTQMSQEFEKFVNEYAEKQEEARHRSIPCYHRLVHIPLSGSAVRPWIGV